MEALAAAAAASEKEDARRTMEDIPPTMGDSRPTMGDSRPTMGDTWPMMGHSRPTMGDTRPTMGDTRPTMGDTRPTMGDTRPTMGDTRPTMGDTRPRMGDTRSTMGDTRPSMGDNRPTMGDTRPMIGDTRPSMGDTRPTMTSDGGNCGKDAVVKMSPDRMSPDKMSPDRMSPLKLSPDRMSLPDDILPLLKEHNLEAIVVNEGWMLIRRKSYIDLFIEDQPYNSVEVLLHTVTMQMIIRIWGRTVLNQKQNACIVEEVKRAFSTRPCFGLDVRGANVIRPRPGVELREEPVRRLVSKKCAVWSEDGYSDENVQEVEGALCTACKNISSDALAIHGQDVKTEDGIQNFIAEKSCKDCGASFPNSRNLERHRKNVHLKVRDHICGQCGKGFFAKADLKRHATLKHPMHPAPSNSSNQHECSECGLDFDTILELSAHEESGQCEETFKQEKMQELLMKVKCEIQDESDPESDSTPRHWRDGDDFCLPHMKDEQGNGGGYSQVDTKSFRHGLDPLNAFDDKETLKHLKKALKREKLGHVKWPMLCEVCAEWVSDKESLGNHMRASHPGERPFQCTFCEKAYRSAAQMNIHRKEKHPDTWGVEKKRRLWLIENRGQDSSEYMMQCHLCSQSEDWTSLGDLRAHWNSEHPDMTDKPSNASTGSFPGTCDVCGQSFDTQFGLQLHISRMHNDKLAGFEKCDVCGKSFMGKLHLKKHRRQVHQMDNPGPSHLKSAMCDICGKAFTPGNLKKHMRMHGDNRHKKCTYCDREFPTYKAMTGHRKFAHAEQYKADRDKLMVEEGSINALNENPYYKKWYALKKMKKNENKVPDDRPRPYVCTYGCGKAYTDRRSLRKHEKRKHQAP